MAFSFELDSRGYIKKRESYDLEYKQNFQGGDNLLKYIKTLVGMANNKGGQIIFGIQDAPHIPLGMTNNKFFETDPKTIDSTIREYFSPNLRWKSYPQDFNGNTFGVLIVEEAEEKPVVCTKNKGNILREGAIYYRYRGETKEIEYPELKRLLDKEKEKERNLWRQHLEKIAMIGPNRVQLLDIYKGEIEIGDNKILIDKAIINKLNFIKEGHFVEKDEEGIPTLKLIGDVAGVDLETITANSDDLYPLTSKDLQEQLGINSYELQAIIFKYKIKEKPKYHTMIRVGKNNVVHKYSKSLVSVLQRTLQNKDFLVKCKSEYKEYTQRNRKKT